MLSENQPESVLKIGFRNTSGGLLVAYIEKKSINTNR